MENRGWKLSLGFFFVFCCASSVLLARSAGPPTARTGDFGELNCTACHRDNALNTAGGNFSISGVPAEYAPGQTYLITVSISRPGQARWGFELAARAVSSGLQAGTLSTLDENTQIVPAGGIQYIMHTSVGTRPGTNAGSWSFNWTAPTTSQGPVRFGAAGNAANNNGANTGDFIYTTTATSNGPAVPTAAQFAHVTFGGGYSTAFTFLNIGNTPLNGALILTGSDGAPLNATLSQSSIGPQAPGVSPINASASTLSIAPGGAMTITASAANPADANKSGWARVESTGGTLVGVANFQLLVNGKLQTTAGVLSAESVESATIPVIDNDALAIYTGYAVANPSSTDAVTIRVVMVKEDGTAGPTLTPIILAPGQQVARFFVQDPAASKAFNGSAVLIGPSGKKFAAVALIQNQGLLTAIPVASGKVSHIN